jgi:hypothetical protein
MMLLTAVLAVELLPAHFWFRGPYYRERAHFHAIMAGFCECEAALFLSNADECSRRAELGLGWNDPSEESENLRCCPYPNDVPRYGSWLEQAEVWARASARAARAATWHERMSDMYSSWYPFPYRDE